MTGSRYFVYVAYGSDAGRAGADGGADPGRPLIGVSHRPALDLAVLAGAGYERLRVVAGPLPLAQAERVAAREAGAPSRRLGRLGLERLGLGRRGLGEVGLREAASVALPPDEDVEAVLQVLRGRILFDNEIRRALGERGHPVAWPLEDVAQVLVARGLVRRAPAVSFDRFGTAQCARCGSTDVVEAPCASCGDHDCLHCVECVSMGEARSCRPLYFADRLPAGVDRLGVDQLPVGAEGPPSLIHRPPSPVCGKGLEPEPGFELPFELTRAQQDASRLVADFVRSDARRECLVFAVCGAGKTEVSFAAISRVLAAGGTALFAVPRSDVVAEVAPRVQAAFPRERVVALRGASQERYQDARVVVATTHQVLRFYEAFDLVVLDEADAFPYRGSRMLRYAIRRATAPQGKTVFMTGTPDAALLGRADRGEVELIRIPARHHGRPVPEPVVVRAHLPPARSDDAGLRSARRLGPGAGRAVPDSPPRLPREVTDAVLESLGLGRRLFVFVPTVELAGRIESALRAALGAGPRRDAGAVSVASVHSRHPGREGLRERFKSGEIDVLVTTTLMERGITVPNVDVLVLYADFERVFDSGTLIQMAGRAGRTSEHPSGRVLFVAERETAAMRAAIACIRSMNDWAARSGYLAQTQPE